MLWPKGWKTADETASDAAHSVGDVRQVRLGRLLILRLDTWSTRTFRGVRIVKAVPRHANLRMPDRALALFGKGSDMEPIA